MRIAHVVLTRRFAGSERYAIELANAQAAQHDVTLILHRDAAQTRPDALIQHVDDKVKPVFVGGLMVQRQVRQVLRQLRPDVAHAHLSAACKSLKGLQGLCLRVATLHIRYKPQQHAHLDALVAIAPWQLDAVDARLRPHTRQIDNWTMPSSVAVGVRERLRASVGLAPDAWVIGSLGRVEPSKGFDLLIEAFERVRVASKRDIWLVVVGDGRDLPTLRKRAGSHVHFTGFSNAPAAWLAAFDGFVSAARSESFGLVFLEAMNAGLPVLATRTDGALHLESAMRARLVAADDVEALTAGLGAFVAEQPPRQTYDMAPWRIGRALVALDAFYRDESAQLM